MAIDPISAIPSGKTFWAYGYGDIYNAVFSPYSYDDYVQGPRAPERMARLKQSIAQGCNEEAGEVTGWPIDQIQAAVGPDQRQSQMLDDLGNAVVKASDAIRAHCQTNVAFTPTGRLDQMHDRLGALVDAVNTVSPPLSGFYDSLNDEQKARFDHIAPRAPRHGQAAQSDLTTATIRGQCDAGMMAWPTDQIDHVVRPDDAQRANLQALQSAAAQAADTIKAACPAAMCRRRRRRGSPRSASVWGPCCKGSRRCSRRLPISTIRSATTRRPASIPWVGNCSRRKTRQTSNAVPRTRCGAQ
jgi:LTXXQ motif family protein